MSQQLCCEFVIPSEKGPTYWWPILFETMGWKAFHFTAPEKPEGRGFYYYVNLHNQSNTDFVESSFRAAWERIYEGTSEMLVTFWHSVEEEEAFPVDLSLRENTPGQVIGVYLYLDRAYLPDADRAKVHSRLTLILDCAKALYEVCYPCTGEMYWDEGQPIATFGEPPGRNALEAAKGWGPNMQFVKHLLPGGNALYLLDPLPVRIRGGWDFMSLLE